MKGRIYIHLIHLLNQFWTDVVFTSCFLINRISSLVVSSDALCNVIFSHDSLVPVVASIFGSTCYVQHMQPTLSQLDCKALKMWIWGDNLIVKIDIWDIFQILTDTWSNIFKDNSVLVLVYRSNHSGGRWLLVCTDVSAQEFVLNKRKCEHSIFSEDQQQELFYFSFTLMILLHVMIMRQSILLSHSFIPSLIQKTWVSWNIF